MANIVWIVIYALPRSFWAQNRRNWRQFFDGLKLAPWRAILGFWPKSMKIMPKSRIILYELWSTRARNHLKPKIARIGDWIWSKMMQIMHKSRLILYESWCTRGRDHFKPKIAAIGDDFLTGPNWRLGWPFWVFGQNRCKSSPNQGLYCMNVDLRVRAIILTPKSPRLETIFSLAQMGTLQGDFGFLVRNDANHAQIKANIVWIVIYACPRSFWAQNRRDWRQFFDGPKLAPWRAILGFWSKSMQIMPKSRLILYESWSTRARDHFAPKIAAIGDNILTGPNCNLGGPFWDFGQNRCKSYPNQG